MCAQGRTHTQTQHEEIARARCLGWGYVFRTEVCLCNQERQGDQVPREMVDAIFQEVPRVRRLKQVPLLQRTRRIKRSRDVLGADVFFKQGREQDNPSNRVAERGVESRLVVVLWATPVFIVFVRVETIRGGVRFEASQTFLYVRGVIQEQVHCLVVREFEVESTNMSCDVSRWRFQVEVLVWDHVVQAESKEAVHCIVVCVHICASCIPRGVHAHSMGQARARAYVLSSIIRLLMFLLKFFHSATTKEAIEVHISIGARLCSLFEQLFHSLHGLCFIIKPSCVWVGARARLI